MSKRNRSCAGPQPIFLRRNYRERLYSLVSELAANGIPVPVSLRMLKVSRAPFYPWRRNRITSIEPGEAYRANALCIAHRDQPELGHRFLRDEADASGKVTG